MKGEVKLMEHRCGTEWPLPRMSPGAAAFDLRAAPVQPVHLRPHEEALIPTGIAMHIKDPGVAMLILPRSGLGRKGLVLGNTVGLIDSDYQGEIMIAAWNRSPIEVFTISPGDRIAQAIFVPVLHPTFEAVAVFSEETDRGAGGFNSTGVR